MWIRASGVTNSPLTLLLGRGTDWEIAPDHQPFQRSSATLSDSNDWNGSLDRFVRIYQFYRLLAGRPVPLSLEDLTTELECSEPTVKRTIRTMRDHIDAPFDYDRERNGYLYAGDGIRANWELPGL